MLGDLEKGLDEPKSIHAKLRVLDNDDLPRIAYENESWFCILLLRTRCLFIQMHRH